MEESNPWLDPNSGMHKNKKSCRPGEISITSTASIDLKLSSPALPHISNLKEKEQQRLIPSQLKGSNEKIKEFFHTLLTDSLDVNLPLPVKHWAIENFDEKWLQDFLSDIKNLQNNIEKAEHFPNHTELLLLKMLFLIRQGFNY